MAVRISCGVGCPKFNPQSEFISDEEKREFQGFKPMDTLHPEENGGSEADFAKQSACPTGFILLSTRQSLE